MTTLFISDLHLSAERPEITGLFLDFLAHQAAEAEALYILGDLFEAWLGDDLILPEYQPVLEALHGLSTSGVGLYIMHGNRDFLLGEAFTAQCGATLLPDPCTIDLYGRPTLLMHGDLLCTDDRPYQEMRAQLRQPQWIEAFLAKSAEERIAFARELREISRKETGRKEEAIMDINAQTLQDYLQAHPVERLIHGHTHRPAVHEHAGPNGPVERIVLSDWYREGHYLSCEREGCRSHSLPG